MDELHQLKRIIVYGSGEVTAVKFQLELLIYEIDHVIEVQIKCRVNDRHLDLLLNHYRVEPFFDVSQLDSF